MKMKCVIAAAFSLVFVTAQSVATISENLSNATPTAVPGGSRSVGQAVVETTKSAQIERFVSQAQPVYRFTMQGMDEDQVRKTLATNNTVSKQRAPLQISVGGDVPENLQRIPLSSLAWESQPDGSRAAKVSVDVVGAAGVRLGYRVSGPVEGAILRFADNTNSVYLGPPLESDVRRWSPTISGGSGVIEIQLKPGFDPSAYTMSIEKISQWAKSNSDQKGDFPRSPSSCSSSPFNIGCRDACNVDLACVSNPSQALIDIGRATVKVTLVDDASGRGASCTGTLLNSNASPRRPYIFIAAHCIDSQSEAASVETFWFFDSVSCGDTLTVPPFQRVTTGASLKVVDANLDVSLIEMNSSPPLGAVYASWDASIIPRNATLVGVHHPAGDLKTFSEGTMQGYVPSSRGIDSYIQVRWTPGKGTTEEGSSGSGIFTFNADCGGGVACYQLRGGLEGGGASCQNPNAPDRYSRMDLLFTRLAPFLSPQDTIPVGNGTTGTMVEYYNPEFDYYFMTSRELEKPLLDNLRDPRNNQVWYRTGFWFKVDPFASPSTTTLTRYYVPGAARREARGSHFYTALNGDKLLISGTGKERFDEGCAGVPNSFFCNEGTDSYVGLPIGSGPSATCFNTEQRVWRVFRGNPVDDGNHRYVTTPEMYSYMVNELGWTAENVNMCVRR